MHCALSRCLLPPLTFPVHQVGEESQEWRTGSVVETRGPPPPEIKVSKHTYIQTREIVKYADIVGLYSDATLASLACHRHACVSHSAISGMKCSRARADRDDVEHGYCMKLECRS